jgi:flagellin
MQQLSTGSRINSAKDDAAGLAISNKMTSQIRGLDQAVRNANDAISLLQTAEGALVEITNMMQRMRELSVQSGNDTNSPEDRAYLQLEFAALSEEITRVRDTTQFNNMNLLDGSGNFTFQIGANASQTMQVGIRDIAAVADGGRDIDATITAADGTNGQISVLDFGVENTATEFEVGDRIFLQVGGDKFTYTIEQEDVLDFADSASNNSDGVGDLLSIKLASMINSDPRTQGKILAEVTNDGTSVLTLTGIDKDDAYTVKASVSAVTEIAPSTTAPDGTNGQVSALDFGAENTLTEYKAGDIISLNVADVKLSYTITESDVLDFADSASNNDDGVGDAIAVKFASMINSNASLSGVVFAEATNNGSSILTLTGIDLDDAFTLVATSTGGSASGVAGDISTQTGANSAIADLSTAIKSIDEQRATLGATINRLTHSVDNLTNASTNTSAARSRIMDTDYAKATTELSRSQIIQQAATAMLAQANQQPSAVLSLLQ